MKYLACLIVLLAGCDTMPTRDAVRVPVTTACVTVVPDKPTRLTPCGSEVSNVQCFKNLAIDVETLDSAVDQLRGLLSACK